MRTYLYKLTSDRGGAPCVPPPLDEQQALLTVSICKPAIRRTAQPGDLILGITGQTLHTQEGYPLLAVIYAAVVGQVLDPRVYYAADSPYRQRPDCLYEFHPESGELLHAGRSPLHSQPEYAARDVGSFPYYRNARTLLSHDFRYFGSGAVVIPARLSLLRSVAESLGQGHRVFEQEDPESSEADALFRFLWKKPTHYTPARVEQEAPGHLPRSSKKQRSSKALA